MKNELRIAHMVVAADYGGGETLISHLAKYRFGLKASVVSLTYSENFDKTLEKYGVEKYFLSSTRLRPTKLGYIRVLLKSLMNSNKLIKLIRDNSIEIVHCHGAVELFLTVFVSFYYKPFKIVYTHHTVMGKKNPITRTISRFLFSRVDAVTAVSESSKKSIEDALGFFRISVIYNFINPIFNTANSHATSKDERVQLLSVGRLVPLKRHIDVLRAIGVLNVAERAKFFLTIVGSGPEYGNLANFIMQNSLNDCVTLAGYIPNDDLGDTYTKSDLMMFVGENEGFCLAIAEGMAFGLPVLTTERCLAVREVAGEAAIIVSLEDMADTLRNIDKLDFQALAEIAIKRAQKYSYEEICLTYMNLYKSLLN